MTDESRSKGPQGSGSRGQGGSGRNDRARSGQSRDGGKRGDRKGSSQSGRPSNSGDRRSDSKAGGSEGRNRQPRQGGSRKPAQRDGKTAGNRPTAQAGDNTREAAPKLPDRITANQLDREVRQELGTLPRSLAEAVARHLVMAGELIDEDPETAYEHAAYARRKASRVGAVREASGVAAYRAGKWQEALSDLRAARRMSGQNNFLALLADCERGLGRPERALEFCADPQAQQLDVADRVELRIVAAGARTDLGQLEAALIELQIPELKERRARPWAARLFYAYADALLAVGRKRDARNYFAHASAVDREGMTDADERLAALEGLELVDSGDGLLWSDAEEEPETDSPDSGEIESSPEERS